MPDTVEAIVSLSAEKSNVLPFTKGLTGVNVWFNSITRYVEVMKNGIYGS
jgi:hypothetical protein